MKKIENFFENTFLGQLIFVSVTMSVFYWFICLCAILQG